MPHAPYPRGAFRSCWGKPLLGTEALVRAGALVVPDRHLSRRSRTRRKKVELHRFCAWADRLLAASLLDSIAVAAECQSYRGFPDYLSAREISIEQVRRSRAGRPLNQMRSTRGEEGRSPSRLSCSCLFPKPDSPLAHTRPVPVSGAGATSTEVTDGLRQVSPHCMRPTREKGSAGLGWGLTDPFRSVGPAQHRLSSRLGRAQPPLWTHAVSADSS